MLLQDVKRNPSNLSWLKVDGVAREGTILCLHKVHFIRETLPIEKTAKAIPVAGQIDNQRIYEDIQGSCPNDIQWLKNLLGSDLAGAKSHRVKILFMKIIHAKGQNDKNWSGRYKRGR